MPLPARRLFTKLIKLTPLTGLLTGASPVSLIADTCRAARFIVRIRARIALVDGLAGDDESGVGRLYAVYR